MIQSEVTVLGRLVTRPFGRRLAVFIVQILIGLTCVVAWHFVSGTLIDSLLISNPTDVWTQAIDWFKDGTIVRAVVDTLAVVAGGLFVGTAVGVVVGWIVGFSRSLESAVTPPITVLFAIPKVALVPLFILWFGISFSERLVFTSIVVFFFMYFAALNGVKQVQPAMRTFLQLTGASAWQEIRYLYAPASIGWLLGGWRIAVPYAFVAAVTAEIVASRDGLGSLIKSSSAVLNAAGMFVAIIVLMVITSVAGVFVGKLEKWSRWHL